MGRPGKQLFIIFPDIITLSLKLANLTKAGILLEREIQELFIQEGET
ncbi:MAG: hypothetical protein JWP00_1362 [Chloroflexi bacterium]|jgi:hypothetical protein|nr:hypothetical protein [Chloroflexota bacterium]